MKTRKSDIKIFWIDQEADRIKIQNESQLRHAIDLTNELEKNLFFVEGKFNFRIFSFFLYLVSN